MPIRGWRCSGLLDINGTTAGPAPAVKGTGTRPARLYLARHGRTPLNAAGALRGHIDVPLDDVGTAQAQRLGVAMGALGPRYVVSSPLRRARQTAEPYAERAGLPIIVDERLIDRDYGQWAGTSAEAVVAQWVSIDSAPGVEPAARVRQRVLAALADIAQAGHGEDGLVVSHDVVIRTALAALDPGLGDPDRVPQETGCFNTLEYHQQAGGTLRWVVVKVNEIPGEAS